MKSRTLAVFSLFLGIGATAPAQSVSAEFSPNPALPGAPITLTCTDATGQGAALSSPCTWFTIHRGSQAGPVVQLGLFCPTVIVPIAPGGTFNFTWDQMDDNGRLVPPDVYWFEVRTLDAALTTFRTDWFCISIQSATEAALSAGGPARIAQSTPLQIAAPQEPSSIYIAAVGFSANNPIVAPGFETCIEPPVVIDFLVAPIGVLDLAGNSAGLQLRLPNAPFAIGLGIHVQAALFGAGAPVLTNSLTFTIQP